MYEQLSHSLLNDILMKQIYQCLIHMLHFGLICHISTENEHFFAMFDALLLIFILNNSRICNKFITDYTYSAGKEIS